MLFVAKSHYAHEGVAVSLALLVVSSLNDYFLSPLGVLCPFLYNLEGRVTCGIPIGLGLVYLLIQAGYKSGS